MDYVIPSTVSIKKTNKMTMIRTVLLSAFKENKVIPLLAFALLFLIIAKPLGASSNPADPYMALTGLIDLRSTFSDGAHSIEELVRMAASRGLKVIFINDHDRIALSYGIPPFRRVLRYRKEFPSIMTHGPDKFLDEIGFIR